MPPLPALSYGLADGAGFPLAAAADVILAGESARFPHAYSKVGPTPDGGSSLLVSTLGLHRTLHLALLNPVLSASQAHAMGLVCAVHPDDELNSAAERLVAELLAGSRAAQVGAKRLLREQVSQDPEAALQREAVRIQEAAGGIDGREGVRALLERRPPEFTVAAPTGAHLGQTAPRSELLEGTGGPRVGATLLEVHQRELGDRDAPRALPRRHLLEHGRAADPFDAHAYVERMSWQRLGEVVETARAISALPPVLPSSAWKLTAS